MNSAVIIIEEMAEISVAEFDRIVKKAVANGQTIIVHLPKEIPERTVDVDMMAAAFEQAAQSLKEIAELKGIVMEDFQCKIIESLPVDPQDYNYQSNKLPPNWKTFPIIKKQFVRRIDRRGRKPYRKVML